MLNAAEIAPYYLREAKILRSVRVAAVGLGLPKAAASTTQWFLRIVLVLGAS